MHVDTILKRQRGAVGCMYTPPSFNESGYREPFTLSLTCTVSVCLQRLSVRVDTILKRQWGACTPPPFGLKLTNSS